MGEEKECCPVFDPKPWDGVEHVWKDKPFLKGSIPQLFHMPIPGFLGPGIGRLWKQAQDLGIASATEDFLLLMHDPSPWKSELFLSVAKEGPGTVTLSGTFISKVYDGPYNDVPKYIRAVDDYLAMRAKSPRTITSIIRRARMRQDIRAQLHCRLRRSIAGRHRPS